MNKAIIEFINSQIEEQLKIDFTQIKLDSPKSTIPQWDSLNNLNILISIQKEYDITFSAQEYLNDFSIRELYQLTEQKIKEKS